VRMNFFDVEIIRYVNQFSQQSWMLDRIINSLSHNSLLKGCVLSMVIWWAWFNRRDDHSYHREYIISTLFSCVVAIALARALALTLPFRLRPLHEEALHFLRPYGVMPESLSEWSSFPSDHAVLFFALSTGLSFICTKAGIFALSYSILFICFPRIYLGLHYPTDIIVGAAIGAFIAIIVNIYLIKNKYMRSLINLSNSKPHLFYPLLFLYTYQIADMFSSSRALAIDMLKLIQSIMR